MATLTMKVVYVNPPKNGGKRGSIKGSDGTFLGCFGEKLGLFQPGHTYEIDYSEGPFGKNVRSAKEVGGPAPALAASGGGKPYRQTCEADAERMFVCSVLNAFVRANKLPMQTRDIEQAVLMLRRVWGLTFGQPTLSQRAVTAMRSRPVDEMPDWDRDENPAAGMEAAE